jgi:hypothetical protein
MIRDIAASNQVSVYGLVESPRLAAMTAATARNLKRTGHHGSSTARIGEVNNALPIYGPVRLSWSWSDQMFEEYYWLCQHLDFKWD